MRNQESKLRPKRTEPDKMDDSTCDAKVEIIHDWFCREEEQACSEFLNGTMIEEGFKDGMVSAAFL